MKTINTLLRRLWNDDDGAVITTEYLMLGSALALGSATGLNAIKDATVAECQDYAKSVRGMNQSYSVPGQSACGASCGGSAVTNAGPDYSSANAAQAPRVVYLPSPSSSP